MKAAWAGVLATGVLAACGGGGSDAGTTPTVVTISAANQDAVAKAGARAMTSVLGAGGGLSGATASPGGASALSFMTPGVPRGISVVSLGGFVARTLADPSLGRRTIASATASDSPRALAAVPITLNCEYSGSFTSNFIDADSSGAASAGDSLTISFAACRSSADDRIDGSLGISISTYSISGGLAAFDGAMSMQALTVQEGTRTASMNGNVTLSYAELSSTQTRFIMVAGASGLLASTNEGSGTANADSIAFEPGFGMNLLATDNTSLGTASYSSATLDGVFSASSIGGRVTLETSEPVLRYDTDDYPRDGTLRMLGNASALRLQILDATTVRLDLDANLDGTYEATKDVLWSTLLPG